MEWSLARDTTVMLIVFMCHQDLDKLRYVPTYFLQLIDVFVNRKCKQKLPNCFKTRSHQF